MTVSDTAISAKHLDPQPFMVFGLQRTGTNLAEVLVRRNFATLSMVGGVEWKHGPYTGHTTQHDGRHIVYIICIKNPYAWLDSVYRFFRRDFKTDRTIDKKFNPAMLFAEFIRSPHFEYENPVQRWSSIYKQWWDTVPVDRRTIIQQEDMLGEQERQIAIIRRIQNELDLVQTEDPLSPAAQRIDVDGSRRGPMDHAYYLTHRYLRAYTEDDLAFVHRSVDHSVLARYGYSIDIPSNGWEPVLEKNTGCEPFAQSKPAIHLRHIFIDRPWTYERVGHDRRPMEFLADGRIGKGGARCEQSWAVAIDELGPFLDIWGQNGRTCRCRQHGDKWIGRWLMFERMEVCLTPKDVDGVTSNPQDEPKRAGQIGVDRQNDSNMFCHPGDIGDIIYAMPTVRAMGGGALILYPSDRSRQPMTRPIAESLAKLLRTQPYISDVVFQEKPAGIKLDLWRNVDGMWMRNLAAAHLSVNGFLTLGQSDHPWLEIDPSSHPYDVLFHRSPRYHNPAFPWKQIADKYRSIAAFVGSTDEYRSFCEAYGRVPHLQTRDLLELARSIKGSALFVGNQSAPYAIAEAMKHQVILEVWPRCANCLFYRKGSLAGWDADIELPEDALLPNV